MTTRTVVGAALTTWRDAERLLEELPPLSPDHETAALARNAARDLYHSLVDAAAVTGDQLASARATIASARELLDAIRQSHR